MNDAIRQRIEQIDGRSHRERIMILAALVLIPWFFAQQFVFPAIDQERDHLAGKNAALIRSMVSLTQKRNHYLSLGEQAAPDLAADLAQHQARIAELEARVAEAVGKLVSPAEMNYALRTLLQDFPGVTLVALESLEAEPIRLSAPVPETQEAQEAAADGDAEGDAAAAEGGETPETAVAEADVILYRHGLTLTLRGDYLATMRFLQTLREAPWTMYWDSLAYQIDRHPSGEARLNVYTLSLEEALVGS